MTTLRCDVADCNHNKQNCCCNNEITVGGVQAESSSETSCKNFEYKINALSNDVRDINPSLYVSCTADTCAYNKGQSCTANSIEISNNLSSYASDTECASFKER